MASAILPALAGNFLGQAPVWYKQTIAAFLVRTPLFMWLLGPYLTGWILVVESIFTLAMASAESASLVGEPQNLPIARIADSG
ncbi:hypothetical protein [Halopseudomonas xinjiangensis]|uniref:hypothetical protein n=1 Tax=Halopseudomonas xinjiangensis TaxID=487184 RepID=UPI000B8150D0